MTRVLYDIIRALAKMNGYVYTKLPDGVLNSVGAMDAALHPDKDVTIDFDSSGEPFHPFAYMPLHVDDRGYSGYLGYSGFTYETKKWKVLVPISKYLHPGEYIPDKSL